MDMKANKMAFSISEAAEQLGLARSSLYGLLAKGSLRSVKAGGRRLIPVSSVEEFLQGEGQ